MARNNDSDKSDAAQTFDSLNVGDVIRLPNHYSNALAVEETTEIGVRVEFVDDSLAARGTSKDLIRSTFTGEYGLVAGTSDKGTVWDVEVVARVADDEDTDDEDDEEEVRTDGGVDEGGETIRVGDAVALDEWGVGTVTELPQDRDDGLLRIRFDRSSRNLTVYLNRRVEEVDRIPDAADSDDDPDDEDLVEFTVTFEAPVSSADLRDTFQDLADAAAEEADSCRSTDANDDVRTDGGDPVADAAAFEDALQSFVEGAILDGVHPSDASTVLFTEANQIAGAMWSPDRDDAEILP